MTWRDRAACRGKPTDWFYPPSTPGLGTEDRESIAAARAVCRRCPVSDDCLTHALDRPERHGIWAGLTVRQRQARRGAA